MAESIRVGIIGANPGRGWALTSHLPALQVLPGFEVTAVATTRQESADETAKAFGIPHAFGDATELLSHPDVDVVSVCVKVPHHYEYVRAAIEAGKHVYCEWPLGANSEQASELAALAAARGVRHVVGLQGRKSPLVNFVRDLVAEGYVGRRALRDALDRGSGSRRHPGSRGAGVGHAPLERRDHAHRSPPGTTSTSSATASASRASSTRSSPSAIRTPRCKRPARRSRSPPRT